ncbi:MAG: hypothetical protein HYX27_11810 [Acidobacteria bacterium]|nr:hypothetical protein [Acidobacteriota bacterium]
MTRLGVTLALAAPLMFADFRYDQSSRMTGGAMMSMMQLAARFGKNVAQPANSTVAVKGNLMVMNHGKTATIYDLDKETITEVNFEKKEYSVTTFAEMKAFLEKTVMKTGSGETSIDIDVKDTGKEEVIGGMKAKEFLMAMKVEGTNPQNGQKAEFNMEMSSWIAPKLPGYDEMADFHKRMAQKMDLAGMFGGTGVAGMGRGMAAAAKKMAEMDGIPVMQIVRMIPTDPEQLKAMEQQQQAAQAQQGQQPQMPNAGQVAGQTAGQAATSAVAGRLGRFGGLGAGGLGGGLGGLRKKKEEAAPPLPPPAPTPVADAAAASGVKGSFTSEVSMMEMTMESKNFSNSGVEDSMFAVPGGFKLVKGSMQR